jgi:hypothetical protein
MKIVVSRQSNVIVTYPLGQAAARACSNASCVQGILSARAGTARSPSNTSSLKARHLRRDRFFMDRISLPLRAAWRTFGHAATAPIAGALPMERP